MKNTKKPRASVRRLYSDLDTIEDKVSDLSDRADSGETLPVDEIDEVGDQLSDIQDRVVDEELLNTEDADEILDRIDEVNTEYSRITKTKNSKNSKNKRLYGKNKINRLKKQIRQFTEELNKTSEELSSEIGNELDLSENKTHATNPEVDEEVITNELQDSSELEGLSKQVQMGINKMRNLRQTNYQLRQGNTNKNDYALGWEEGKRRATQDNRSNYSRPIERENTSNSDMKQYALGWEEGKLMATQTNRSNYSRPMRDDGKRSVKKDNNSSSDMKLYALGWAEEYKRIEDYKRGWEEGRKLYSLKIEGVDEPPLADSEGKREGLDTPPLADSIGRMEGSNVQVDTGNSNPDPDPNSDRESSEYSNGRRTTYSTNQTTQVSSFMKNFNRVTNGIRKT